MPVTTPELTTSANIGVPLLQTLFGPIQVQVHGELARTLIGNAAVTAAYEKGDTLA